MEEKNIIKRIEALENQQEELFVAVSRYVADKTTVVEIVQDCVASHFGLNKNCFNNYSLHKKNGIKNESEKVDVVARYWLSSILYTWFDKDVSWLEKNYSWYHRVYRQRFERRYMNALTSKEKRTEQEQSDREIYFSIMSKIKEEFQKRELWNTSTEIGLNFFELLK